MYHKNIAKLIVCATAFAAVLTGAADTETVNGVVVEGVGYGIAQTVNLKNYAGDGRTFSKRAAVSWTVLVK